MEITKIQLLTAKAESTYGTDPTPTPAANAIAVVGDTVAYEVASTRTERPILDGGFAMNPGWITQKTVTLKFRTELRGNRTDGSTPDISAGASGQALDTHPLFAATNIAANYTAESSGSARDGYVTYKPTLFTTEGPGVTIWWYTHLKVHKLNGGKGTFRIVLEAGKPGYIEWTFQGLYVAVADATFPTTQALLATKPPTFVGSTATWASYAAIFSRMNVDLGNAIQRRDDALSTDGVKGFLITGRKSAGDFDPESVAEATHPYWANWAADTAQTLSVLIGTQSGNKCLLTMSVQMRSLSYADRNEQRVKNAQFDIVNSALGATLGNDFQLKFF